MILTAELVARGLSGREIARIRNGSTRIRRGVYVESTGDPWHAYELLCSAVAARLHPAAALTGPSAALFWDLPMVGAPPSQVWIRGITPGRYAHDVKVVSRQMPQILEKAGLRVVCPAWAVADCARLIGRREGLIMADAALREGLCTREELVAAATVCRGSVGVGRLRWVAAFADGQSESPGESWLRMVLFQLGYAVQLQVLIEDGAFRARVDMLLDGSTLVLEFDGLMKYEDRAVVGAEKERQAHLEALGYTVLRVTWAQLSDPGLLDRRIRAALGKSPQV